MRIKKSMSKMSHYMRPMHESLLHHRGSSSMLCTRGKCIVTKRAPSVLRSQAQAHKLWSLHTAPPPSSEILYVLMLRDVVEDLKAFKAGRFRPNEKSPQMSPADSKPNNISPSYDGSQVRHLRTLDFELTTCCLSPHHGCTPNWREE